MKTYAILVLAAIIGTNAWAQIPTAKKNSQVGFINDYMNWTPDQDKKTSMPEKILDGFNPPRNQAQFDRLELSHGKKQFTGVKILDNGDKTYTAIYQYTPAVGGSGGPTSYVQLGATAGKSYYLIRQVKSLDEAKRLGNQDNILTSQEQSKLKSWIGSTAQLPKSIKDQWTTKDSKLHEAHSDADSVIAAATDPQASLENFKNSDTYLDFKIKEDDPMNPDRIREKLRPGDIICSVGEANEGLGLNAGAYHVGVGYSTFRGGAMATCALKQDDKTVKVKTQHLTYRGHDLHEGAAILPVSVAAPQIPWPLSDIIMYSPYNRHQVTSATKVKEETHTYDLSTVCGVGAFAAAYTRFHMGVADACAKRKLGVDGDLSQTSYRNTVLDRRPTGPTTDKNAIFFSRKDTVEGGCAHIREGSTREASEASYEDCHQGKAVEHNKGIPLIHRHKTNETFMADVRSSRNDPEQKLTVHASAHFSDAKGNAKSLKKMVSFVEQATGHRFFELDLGQVKGQTRVSLDVDLSAEAVEKIMKAKGDDLWTAVAKASGLSEYDVAQWSKADTRASWLDRVKRTRDDSSKKAFEKAQDIVNRVTALDGTKNHRAKVEAFLAIAKEHEDKPLFIRALLELSQGAPVKGTVQFSNEKMEAPITYAIRSGGGEPLFVRNEASADGGAIH